MPYFMMLVVLFLTGIAWGFGVISAVSQPLRPKGVLLLLGGAVIIGLGVGEFIKFPVPLVSLGVNALGALIGFGIAKVIR